MVQDDSHNTLRDNALNGVRLGIVEEYVLAAEHPVICRHASLHDDRRLPPVRTHAHQLSTIRQRTDALTGRTSAAQNTATTF